MNIKGKLIEKFETQILKDSFQKREFVIEYAENPNYPELLKFELIQSNCEQLDEFSVGDMMSVTFNLKGRKWTDPEGNVKYFTSLQAWRLERGGEDTITENSESQEWTTETFSEDDDLPF